MKIAFINQPWNSCPPIEFGSIAIWTYEVARNLSKMCDITVYAKSSKMQKRVEFIDGIQFRRISTYFDGLLQNYLQRFLKIGNIKNRLFATNFFYLCYIVKIAYDLKKQNCDIVHIHNFSQFVPVIKAFNPKVKIVLHMHCEWLTQLDRSLIEKRINHVDLIIGCSKYITEKICKRFPLLSNRCYTIYNGVNTDHFVNNDTKLKKKNDSQRLLFVGRITPEKGIHILLKAFEIVVKHYPKAHLEIVGPYAPTAREFIIDLKNDNNLSHLEFFYKGSYLTHLHSMVEPDLKNHISFSNSVPQYKLKDYYCNADILVNPSFSESFGMSLIEAMACQVPVVATHVGGMTEIVNNKAGILVEPGNIHALADAIMKLMSNEDLRISMGQAARNAVENFFSWNRIAENLLFQYERIIKNNDE